MHTMYSVRGGQTQPASRTRPADHPVAPASAAAAVLPLLAAASGPAHHVAEFASTHLYRLDGHPSTSLIALTRRSASYSANSIRLDDRTFEALRSVPELQIDRPRTLHAPRRTIQITRTWRSDVVRRTEIPAAEPLRGLLPEPPHAPTALEHLIGWGPGLTPTGDDLVCGFLAAARSFADPALPAQIERVRSSLHRTADLSAQFLRHACEGQVSGELRELLLALGTDRLPGAVRRIRAVGHTSGTDLAHGVLRYLTHATGHQPPTASLTRSVTDRKES